jgi:formylglycine-generating enzyme required for sulfatase activity
MMGAADLGNAKPPHRVTVETFRMAKTLVTNSQYKACVEAGACTPAHFSDGSCWFFKGGVPARGTLPASFQADEQPVVCVDWAQAKAFSEWVGGRLPSEAEWEYAARSGGKDWNYPWGDDAATCGRAVMDLGCGLNSPWPVCSMQKGNTEQGLCDMAGNAAQWLQDWYHDSYSRAPADGSAWNSSAGSARVVRGGSWRHGADFARSAFRAFSPPGDSVGYLGFRPAR